MSSVRAATLVAAFALLGGVVCAQEQDAPDAAAPAPAPEAPDAPALSAEGGEVLVSLSLPEGVAKVRVERALVSSGEPEAGDDEEGDDDDDEDDDDDDDEEGDDDDAEPSFVAAGEIGLDPEQPKLRDLSFRDSGQPEGATLAYRLIAIGADGQESEPSEPTQIRLVRAPVEVRVEPDEKEPKALRVHWTDADPEGSVRFKIERRSIDQARGPWVVGDPPRPGQARVAGTKKKSKKDKRSKRTEFSSRDRDVDSDVIYEYRVVAQGSDSVAASVIVRSAPKSAPRAPQTLRSGAFTVDRISLRWIPGSRDVESYRVERRAPGGSEWSALGEPLPPYQTSFADPVKAGQAFEYRVVAVNSVGEAGSEATRARTPTKGPSTPGVTGPSGVHRGPTAVPDTAAARPQILKEHFSPLPDRWRISFPEWNRYPEKIVDPSEAPYRDEGSVFNPYTQNVLKGDYPIFGNDIFMVLEGQSDTLVEGRAFPFPSGVSTRDRGSEKFFGDFDQVFFNQNFVLSAELFQGDTAFRPKDAAVKVTAVANVNYLQAYENNLVNIDVREGDDRLDGWVGIQEALIDKHIVDLGSNYDFVTLIAGVQKFQSDFRGFMFADNNLGVRLQTNYLSNRLQLNLAAFHQLEKDTNSGLNRYRFRDQNVFVANLYIQDVFKELGNAVFGHDVLGYTLLLNYHFNLDQGGKHFDQNDFIVRPAKIGQSSGAFGGPRDKDVEVHYLGFGGEGHIGPINLSHQYYMAIGETSFNEISGEEQNVLAHFFAIEASIDVDWLRLKASYLYASGDPNPSNGRASGFSAIFDNPFFAGSGFSYYNRQNIPLVQTGVQLTNRLSLLPDLRSSKLEGQSNFVNPGLHMFNVGASARLTQKLFIDVNVNFLYFDTTEPLQFVLVQNDIDRTIGVDYSVGVQYRPFLTDNVIITAGGSALVPGSGFRQIYTAKTLYSGFVALTLTY